MNNEGAVRGFARPALLAVADRMLAFGITAGTFGRRLLRRRGWPAIAAAAAIMYGVRGLDAVARAIGRAAGVE